MGQGRTGRKAIQKSTIEWLPSQKTHNSWRTVLYNSKSYLELLEYILSSIKEIDAHLLPLKPSCASSYQYHGDKLLEKMQSKNFDLKCLKNDFQNLRQQNSTLLTVISTHSLNV